MNQDLFLELVSTPGISGREERIRKVVAAALEDLVDDIRVDRLGNLIGHRAGKGPKLMLSAHMDSIGFIVKHVDDGGFLRISPVGGFDPRTLVMQRVLVQGKKDYVGVLSPAEKPIHLLDDEERKKVPKIDDLFVDLLLPVEEVKANVAVGDPVSYHREAIVTERAVVAPYLDDRLGVYVLLEALRAARKTSFDISAVVSVQEEVGVRGAITGAFGTEPDLGIALDVSIAIDIPGADRSQKVGSLGEGASISVMDSMTISDPRMVRRFEELATAHGIKHDRDILLGGGTDARGIQLSRAGVPVVTLGPRVRYVHTVNEAALIEDIEASVDLLAAFLETGHDIDLEWKDA
ncbi:MAG: M42 family metallopeptidase [Actinomycetota bacterium]